MKINKRLIGFLGLLGLNFIGLLFLSGVWLGIYLALGIGFVLGLIVVDGFPGSSNELMLLIGCILFWPAYWVIILVSDSDRIKNFILKWKYGRPIDVENKIEKKLTEEFDVRATADVSLAGGKYHIDLDDIDVLVDNTDLVVKAIVEATGIPENKFIIFWNNEWRYR